MSLGWGDTYAETDDLSDLTFCQMIRTNVEQRYLSVHGGGISSPIPAIALGGDFQLVSFWAGLQGNLQDAVTDGFWLKTTNLTGVVESAISGSTYTWTWADVKTAKLGGNGWTRKYPREIATLAAATYTDGSAFANGHVARNVLDGLVYNRTAGAWVLASVGTLPDTITAYGFAQSGDYVGPWIFNELRDVCNLLAAARGFQFAGGNPWYSGGAVNAKFGASSLSPEAAAEADALAFFDASGATADSPPGAHAWSGPGGDADCGRERSKCRIINPSGLASGAGGATAEADFWIQAKAPVSATGHPGFFDAQGDGVVNGSLVSWDTGVVVAAQATGTSAYLGSLGHPTFPAARDGSNGGWIEDADPVVVFRYDVAGGFANHL